MPKITSASFEEVRAPARDGAAAGAERQRMVLREGALALEAGRQTGHRQQLGQRLAAAAQASRVVHALAGIDHRPLGLDQHRRGRSRPPRGSGAERSGDDGRVVERLRHLLVPDVGRDLDQHRARRGRCAAGEKARRKTLGSASAAVDRLGRLGDVAA